MKTKQIVSRKTVRWVCVMFVWLILVPGSYLQVGPFMPRWERIVHSVLENNENVNGNHTIREVLNFLENDTTNDTEYTTDYNCKDFSYALLRNAITEGFKCGYVIITFDWPLAHAIVVFDTESGFLFVEPQDDEVFFNPRESYNGITDIEILWE